jgi:hypothetical protein
LAIPFPARLGILRANLLLNPITTIFTEEKSMELFHNFDLRPDSVYYSISYTVTAILAISMFFTKDFSLGQKFIGAGVVCLLSAGVSVAYEAGKYDPVLGGSCKVILGLICIWISIRLFRSARKRERITSYSAPIIVQIGGAKVLPNPKTVLRPASHIKQIPDRTS